MRIVWIIGGDSCPAEWKTVQSSVLSIIPLLTLFLFSFENILILLPPGFPYMDWRFQIPSKLYNYLYLEKLSFFLMAYFFKY